MLLLVLDANAIAGDPQMSAPVWSQFAESVAKGASRVIIPRIAVAEAKATRARARETVADTMVNAAQHAQTDAKQLVQQAAQLTRQDAKAYPAWLDARLLDFGFEVLDTPDVSHDELADRAMNRRHPFDSKGNGYRDALHWHSVLHLASTHPDDDIVLVSDDKGFGNPGGPLHEHLTAEAAQLQQRGRVTLAKTPSAVALPGKYRGDAVDSGLETELINMLEQFLFHDKHLAETQLDPRTLDFPAADGVDVVAAERYEIVTLVARELTNLRVLELRFEVSAIVDLGLAIVTGYDADENPQASVEYQVRKLAFVGTALSNEAHDKVASIEELAVEVFRPKVDMQPFLDKVGSIPMSKVPKRTRAEEDRFSAFLAGLPEAALRRRTQVWPSRSSEDI